MNRKNLTDAFGDIEDGIFAVTENDSVNELSPKNSDNVQAPVFIKNVRESKNRKRRKAVISAAAGIAACAVLAVSMPVLFNNTVPPYGEVEPSESHSQQPALSGSDQQTEQTETDTQPITTDIGQEISQIQLYTKIKEILNAEDMYKVEKTQIDLSGFEENGLGENAYGNPFFNVNIFIDGSSFFYTLVGSCGHIEDYPIDESEERYGQIFLFDMDTGEHRLILKERAYKEKNGLILHPVNFVNGWLYYYRREIYPTEVSPNDGTELWRINIDTKAKEKVTDINTLFSIDMKAGIKSGKYLYFTDLLYTFEGVELTNSWILRYDTEEGKLEIFKEAFVNEGKGRFPFVYDYKNGIIYSIDGISFYFHTDDGEPDKFLPDLSSYNQDSKNYFQTIGNSGLIYMRDIPTPFEYNL
ncbi:MAG: hypothetical protein K2K41_00530, partial [Ruminiclostridium sp.]|nr:hypothetical protein [Ruminiclostridium sp.]